MKLFKKADWLCLCIAMIATAILGIIDFWTYRQTNESMSFGTYTGCYALIFVVLYFSFRCVEDAVDMGFLFLYVIMSFLGDGICHILTELGANISTSSRLWTNSMTAIIGLVVGLIVLFKHWYKE